MGYFDEYIIGGTSSQQEKSQIWKTAIGLQDVDGLKPSEYLIKNARKHIDGDITIEEVKNLIDDYYQSKTIRKDTSERTEEADKVSVRIAELLAEQTFNFSPEYLANIHRRLFTGIFTHSGMYRTYNITKREWVLDGDTVLYSSYEMIKDTLDYDFREEKNVDYSSLSYAQALKRICRFISGIWQIHPFCEGNTRTTSVFAIKYLRNFGYNIDNDLFAENSWYFRNALVRANYTNYSNGVNSTSVYLERFFENLLFGTHHELRNRDMRISKVGVKSATDETPKCQNGPLDVTLEERAVLEFLNKHPRATQLEIAEHIGKSTRTVKRLTASLVEKGILKRENGKRYGVWVVIE